MLHMIHRGWKPALTMKPAATSKLKSMAYPAQLQVYGSWGRPRFTIIEQTRHPLQANQRYTPYGSDLEIKNINNMYLHLVDMEPNEEKL